MNADTPKAKVHNSRLQQAKRRALLEKGVSPTPFPAKTQSVSSGTGEFFLKKALRFPSGHGGFLSSKGPFPQKKGGVSHMEHGHGNKRAKHV